MADCKLATTDQLRASHPEGAESSAELSERLLPQKRTRIDQAHSMASVSSSSSSSRGTLPASTEPAASSTSSSSFTDTCKITKRIHVCADEYLGDDEEAIDRDLAQLEVEDVNDSGSDSDSEQEDGDESNQSTEARRERRLERRSQRTPEERAIRLRLRKERRRAKAAAFLRRRYAQQKQQRKQRNRTQVADRERFEKGLMSPEEASAFRDWSDRQNLKKSRLSRWKVPYEEIESTLSKPAVVIDLGFTDDDTMTHKQRTSLIRQLCQLYGFQRRCLRPVQLHLTSVAGPILPLLDQACALVWKLRHHPEHYTQVFPHEKLVYLSPDSPNVLMDLHEDDVYVIGGVVDSNALKNLTLDHAEKLKLRSARLPINEAGILPEGSRFPSNSLNVNTVFQILNQYAETRSWEAALLPFLPTRAGYRLKSATVAED